MRILEIRVKSYRVHEELVVVLDPQRNVIIGPNESGKSTLMEAMHRALFLKASGNRKEHRAMQSTLHSGKPEVELQFEAGGRRYTLKKTYSGQSGKAQLTEVGGKTWQDEAAEEELEIVLGVRGQKLDSAWNHIFVYQGDSGRDPTEFANEYRADLVARFQQSGGAVLQESVKDAEVAAKIAARTNEIFTQGSAARVGSDLGKASAEFEATEKNLEQALETFASRESAVKTYLNASHTIDDCETDIESLESEKQQVGQRKEQINGLQQQVEATRLKVDEADKRLDEFRATNDKISDAQNGLETAKSALEPVASQVDSSKDTVEGHKRNRSALDKTWRAASDAAKQARTLLEVAARHRDLKQADKDHADLQVRHGRVGTLRDEIAQVRRSNAELPEVSVEQVEALNRLDLRVNQAEAAINAIATKVRVIKTDTPVIVDGVDVAAGNEKTFTDETRITIGGGVQLAVVPGGGTNLNQARKEHTDAQQARDALLESVGVSSSTEAATAQSKRQANNVQLANLEAQLDQQGADDLSDAMARNADRLTMIKARLEQLLAGKPEYTEHESLDQAQHAVEAAEGTRDQTASAEETARADLDSLDEAITGAEAALAESETAYFQAKQDLAAVQNRMDLLLGEHGDEAMRAKALIALASERDGHVDALDKLKKQLAEFEPELVTQDLERVDRALKQKRSQSDEAKAAMNQAKGALGSDGSRDPEADVALATAQAARAEEQLKSATLYGQAIQRLHALFTTKQQELADTYTRPLVDKASEYLRPVLGPTTQLRVHLEGTRFSALELYREQAGEGAFEFETLSGGTREQVAAALRLAIAEILAEDHDGCLPIVFDDSFTNSDPERTRNLQRMLDLAASRGLQVIALTCNPTDYNRFGAKEIHLAGLT